MPDAIKPRHGFWARVRVRVATLRQLFATISRGPFWWLTPFCVVLAVFAVLLLLLNVVPGAAPFVYALF